MIPTKMSEDLSTKVTSVQKNETTRHHKTAASRLRAGMTCPYCYGAKLDYNGILQLVCPRCGVLETGTFT